MIELAVARVKVLRLEQFACPKLPFQVSGSATTAVVTYIDLQADPGV